jgi:DinB family protein
MSQISELSDRVTKARERFHRTPSTGPGVYGAPDPQTGERWNAGNVLGHVAEMLPYWTEQARGVLGGATEVGRDEAGSRRRREWIDEGKELPESVLRERVEEGLGGVLALLGDMKDADLERKAVYHAHAGDTEITLREYFERLLIGHFEGHLDQLEGLG